LVPRLVLVQDLAVDALEQALEVGVPTHLLGIGKGALVGPVGFVVPTRVARR
jgi:hypothetical protein